MHRGRNDTLRGRDDTLRAAAAVLVQGCPGLQGPGRRCVGDHQAQVPYKKPLGSERGSVNRRARPLAVFSGGRIWGPHWRAAASPWATQQRLPPECNAPAHGWSDRAVPIWSFDCKEYHAAEGASP